MPTYEYNCRKCGETIEVFQSFTDKPLKTHKVCGGELKKVFHARGIVFKGSGFYATDVKAGSASNGSTETEKKSDPKPKSDIAEKKSEGSVAKKPASKP